MKDNRERVLQKALAMFNEKGSSDVTTNHICEALSISPGNLYYHFRNKDEIIITLHNRMSNAWDELPPVTLDSAANLLKLFDRLLTFLWDYRFIHRELSTLYRQIPPLRPLFDKIQKRRLKEIEMMITELQKAKVLREMTGEETKTLTRTVWFFTLYWLSYLETESGKLTKISIKESLPVLKGLLADYLLTPL